MSVLEQPPADVSLPPGAVLRHARERAGLTLDAVSQRTMIPLSRLKALENDDYDRVGVATFVIGYTRSYARFLGLDPAPLVQTLEPSLPRAEAVPAQAPSVALALQVQKRPRSLFWPTVFAVVVALIVVAVIGINTASFIPQNSSETVAAVPPQTIANDGSTALSIPLNVQSEAPASEVSEPVVPADTAVTEELADSDFAGAPSIQSAEPQPAPTEAEEAVTTEVTPVAESSAPADTLTLTFTEDCWVSVTDATGKALVARLATSGDNLQLFGRAPFEVVLGNASGASIAFNGKALDAAPSPGRKFRRLTVGE